MKLTEAQTQILKCCTYWIAPFEVAARRRERGVATYSRRTEQQLVALRERGLVEFGAVNNTYRITPSGRRALDGGGK